VSSAPGAGKPSPLVAAVVVAVTFGLGFLVGRTTAPEPEHAGPRAGPSATVNPDAPPPAQRSTPVSEPGTPLAAGPLDPLDPPAEVAGPPRAATEAEVDARIARALEAARASQAMPDDHHVAEAVLTATGELEQLLASDPGALARALERLRALTDPSDLETLAAVLGRIADPAVEETALDIARRDVSPTRRMAALDVLDALDTPDARGVALDVLAREQHVDLRRTALRALPDPAGASVEDAGAVVTTLARIVAQDQDVELRRRAAVDLGAWHRSPAELLPLLEALARDPSPEVRSGAAFGLEAARSRAPEVVAALVAALGRPDEDPLVRENAWRALSALGPLPPEARSAWQAYKAEREALGEVDGHHHGHDEDGHDHGH
jgi:hypothetical protein